MTSIFRVEKKAKKEIFMKQIDKPHFVVRLEFATTGMHATVIYYRLPLIKERTSNKTKQKQIPWPESASELYLLVLISARY
jgi:hypothetical protein